MIKVCELPGRAAAAVTDVCVCAYLASRRIWTISRHPSCCCCRYLCRSLNGAHHESSSVLSRAAATTTAIAVESASQSAIGIPHNKGQHTRRGSARRPLALHGSGHCRFTSLRAVSSSRPWPEARTATEAQRRRRWPRNGRRPTSVDAAGPLFRRERTSERTRAVAVNLCLSSKHLLSSSFEVHTQEDRSSRRRIWPLPGRALVLPPFLMFELERRRLNDQPNDNGA